MYKGKQICKTLKEVRRKIAEANDILYEPNECRHQGDCLGTCPKCEEEVRYLERQIELRRSLGKAVSVVGVGMGIAAVSSCTLIRPFQPTAGMVMAPPDTVEEHQIAGIPPAPVRNASQMTDSTADDSQGSRLEAPRIELDAPLVDEEHHSLVVPTDSMEAEYIFGDVMEVQPSFRGGNRALLKFIEENLRYPEEDVCVSGRVVVSFYIEKDGTVTDPEVVRSLHPSFDEEALRVVRLMPKWVPAKLNGKAQRVKYILPVAFKLTSEK